MLKTTWVKGQDPTEWGRHFFFFLCPATLALGVMWHSMDSCCVCSSSLGNKTIVKKAKMINFHPKKKTQQSYVYSVKNLITNILKIKFRHWNSSCLKVFMTGKGLYPSSVSICNPPLPGHCKVFERNNNSALNFDCLKFQTGAQTRHG